jgi:hypothetical protein
MRERNYTHIQLGMNRSRMATESIWALTLEPQRQVKALRIKNYQQTANHDLMSSWGTDTYVFLPVKSVPRFI